MSATNYEFFAKFSRILNSNQSRSIVLSGNVYDLFDNGREGAGQDYVPLVSMLCQQSATQRLFRIVYELNGPVRVLDGADSLKNAWIAWKSGIDPDTLLLRELRDKGPSRHAMLGDQFEQLLQDALGNPTLALELLRQLTVCSRSSHLSGDLLIFIEAADMLLPAGNGDVASLGDSQLQRISIVHDWFNDPAFLAGGDSVCLVAESRSLIHPRISKLPQVLSVDIPAPNAGERVRYIEHFCQTARRRPQFWSTVDDLAVYTAGLSNHALRQLLAAGAYQEEPISQADVVNKVQAFIQSQIGEDVVEFKRVSHGLDDVIGFSKLKQFIHKELLPRFRASGAAALPGAAVAGPIGGGKTFIFEAVAGRAPGRLLVCGLLSLICLRRRK